MKTIVEHEIIRTPEGDIALMCDVLSFDAGQEPVVLVSREEDKAYFHRGPGDVYEIPGINPAIIGEARKAEYIIVLEMLGEKVIHSYDAPAGILEDDEDNS
jgi:hypothetical protein